MTDSTADGTADPIRVVAGGPTDDESAAIAAVFAQLILERDARIERLPEERHRSAWDRSKRSLRGPLDRG